MPPLTDASDQVMRITRVIRIAGVRPSRKDDAAAIEEPLEIRLGGAPFVTIMRTPGRDRDLVAGFLLSEQIVSGPDAIQSIRHCRANGAEADTENVVNVWLAGAAAARAAEARARRRAVAVNSSCGVCGRQSIDDLLGALTPLEDSATVAPNLFHHLPATLRAVQAAFHETGGLHAAALFDLEGELAASAEDVGRHNAVDKVIGWALLGRRLPLSGHVLLVSGRASFEIVQKAAVARIPIVAAVSAPSSLAITLARDAGITLLGFLRGDTYNVYSGAHRLGLQA